MLFHGENGNDRCHWCHYLSCVPTSRWRCSHWKMKTGFILHRLWNRYHDLLRGQFNLHSSVTLHFIHLCIAIKLVACSVDLREINIYFLQSFRYRCSDFSNHSFNISIFSFTVSFSKTIRSMLMKILVSLLLLLFFCLLLLLCCFRF